jgi:hypothetical protein
VAIARKESDGGVVYAFYLVDVFCLGVKNAFWYTGSLTEFKEKIEKIDETQTMVPIEPACLAKIVHGAVEFARAFGFPPHPDYHHASRLLEGIDSELCTAEYTFGRDGIPYYMQGPNETPAQAAAIIARVTEAGGKFTAALSGPGFRGLPFPEDEFDDVEALEGPELDDEEESD